MVTDASFGWINGRELERKKWEGPPRETRVFRRFYSPSLLLLSTDPSTEMDG
jgi:hypothetical protein